MNEWMLSNPGKTVTIYQVAHFVKDAYLAAFNIQNVTKGFITTGIYPLNSKIFSEDDFLTSFMTNRPDPTLSEAVISENEVSKHQNSELIQMHLEVQMFDPTQ
ncbi:hypothetical protein EVAR_10325_1 [Eumeta japonica]|uniref:Uncharacterized protein n=1 Tax=Eumeta variegata TaxID=151549 RepID=A0A4C1TDV3_EUMVA|nr:hypothetical protein EVAR_10325_1 [Eumeta japonica]